MNNNDRRFLLETVRRMNDDYQAVNREYSRNMMDYHRNVHQMLNIISNTYTNTPDPPRRTTNRNTDALEWELLSYYINQFNNQMRDDVPPGLTQEEINTATELVVYDNSMNERRCPITHDDFETGEQVCRIISCGHYFKTHAIYRWLQRNTLCPVCRHNLVQPTPHATNVNPRPINENLGSPRYFSNIFSNILPYNDLSFNTISYTFDIPFNNPSPNP